MAESKTPATGCMQLMVFTKCSSILNFDSPDVDENKSPFVRQRTQRTERHLGRETSAFGV